MPLDGEAVMAKRFSVGIRLRHDVATEFEATAIKITQPKGGEFRKPRQNDAFVEASTGEHMDVRTARRIKKEGGSFGPPWEFDARCGFGLVRTGPQACSII